MARVSPPFGAERGVFAGCNRPINDLALDLRNLRCALSAAELGSFRRAASVLDLPQSTISRRVKLLEHRVGFPLFTRTKSGVRLTEAGADFLRNAIVCARQLDRAAGLAAAVHRGERGKLRVGILGPLAGGFLHDLFVRFRKRYPDIRVTLYEGASHETLHRLAMSELDVSFLAGQLQVSGYHVRPLWRESIYAALPDGHTLAQQERLKWDDIREEQFVVSRGGSGPEVQDYLIRKLSRPGFRPRIEVHDVSRGSLIDLVSMSYGITLISRSVLQKCTHGVVFRPIVGENYVVPYSAVWSKGNSNPALSNLLRLADSLVNDVAGKATPSALRIA